MKAKARNCAFSDSLHILHELLQLFMDREIFEAEDLLISLSICLVMFRDGGHHLVGSIIPDVKKKSLKSYLVNSQVMLDSLVDSLLSHTVVHRCWI